MTVFTLEGNELRERIKTFAASAQALIDALISGADLILAAAPGHRPSSTRPADLVGHRSLGPHRR